MESIANYKKQASKASNELLNEMIKEVTNDIHLLESFYRSGSKHYYLSDEFKSNSVAERNKLCLISSVLYEEKRQRENNK